MKNWKTTLIGALLAGAVAIQPLFEEGSYDYKKLIYAGLIAIFGYVSKDWNVTGGTKKQ